MWIFIIMCIKLVYIILMRIVCTLECVYLYKLIDSQILCDLRIWLTNRVIIILCIIVYNILVYIYYI